jgi:3'-phosphoadenosine 5'-phosphosulfate sulfotransferase (PAPS reductase)/FAD synthetase
MATSDYRKQGPKPQPDWFWLVSGGIDSVAAYILTREALHENYQKRPVMSYLDTTVGLPFNRAYVEALADHYGEAMWSMRTHESFEDRVAKRGKYADRDDAGPPGASQHSNVQNELKGRQREMAASRMPELLYVTGIRAGESEDRAKYPKGEVSRGIRYVKPVYELTKKQCAEIILWADVPINPAWWWNHFSDCGCMANGEPGELDKVEKRFPQFAQRLREYEEAAEKALDDNLRSMLGWDGLTAEESGRENRDRRNFLFAVVGASESGRNP